MTHAHTLCLSKTQNLNPNCPGPGSSDFSEFLSDRSTGSRPALDRHAQFCACVYQSTGTRPGLDRPRELALWKCQSTDPVDRQFKSRRAVDWRSTGGRLAREFCSLEVIGRPSRSTGGCNGQKNDRWPVDRRSTDSSDRTPTALFLGSLYKGILSSVLRLTFWRLLKLFF